MIISRQSPGLRARVHRLTTLLLDQMYPPRCVHCGRAGALLCPTCAQAAQPVPPPICATCGRQQTADVLHCSLCRRPEHRLTLARAAALHVEPLRTAIHHLKYEDCPEMAVPLARYLVAAFDAPCWDAVRGRLDAVIPVPLHAQRLAERGYNQAEKLTLAFCRATHFPAATELLQRVKATRTQVGLDAANRQDNVADAFLATAPVTGGRFLLIDDVYTTGATLNACAATLLAAGAHAVYGLALAQPKLVHRAAEQEEQPRGIGIKQAI